MIKSYNAKPVFLDFYSHLAKYTLPLKLFVNLLKKIKFKKHCILNLTESPAWHYNTVRCKMFNPNIFYLSVLPAQIYGRHNLPKFRFTFMKNVNIQNSLLRIWLPGVWVVTKKEWYLVGPPKLLQQVCGTIDTTETITLYFNTQQ